MTFKSAIPFESYSVLFDSFGTLAKDGAINPLNMFKPFFDFQKEGAISKFLFGTLA